MANKAWAFAKMEVRNEVLMEAVAGRVWETSEQLNAQIETAARRLQKPTWKTRTARSSLRERDRNSTRTVSHTKHFVAT